MDPIRAEEAKELIGELENAEKTVDDLARAAVETKAIISEENGEENGKNGQKSSENNPND